MSKTIQNVYILGSETETIKRCLGHISPEFSETSLVSSIWSDLGNVCIPNDFRSKCRAELSSSCEKGHAQARDGVHAVTERGKPCMQRLKSSAEQSDKCLDYGYESESDNTDGMTVADDKSKSFNARVHVLMLKTEPVTELPSLILHRFFGPGLYILIIDPATFEANKSLYEKIIKELSTYSSVTTLKSDQHSMLYIVDVSQHSKGQKSREGRKLHGSIRTTYFGNHFKMVNLDELLEKISAEKIPSVECQIEIERANEETMFTEIQESDFKEAESSKNKSRLCFKLEEQYFDCHAPDKLMEKFLGMIRNLRERGFLSHTIHPIDNFLDEIEEIEDTNKILAALQTVGLVFEDKTMDRLYIMPLLLSGSIRDNEDEERSLVLDSSIYLLTLNLKSIPFALKTRIVMKCLQKGWMLESLQNKTMDTTKNGITLTKGSQSLLLTFDSNTTGSMLYMSIHQSKCSLESPYVGEVIPNAEENLREEIESLILKSCDMNIEIIRRQLIDKTELTKVPASNRQYVDVDLLLRDGTSLNQCERLLKPWFVKERAMMAEKLNELMSDDKLTKISRLFGKGYELFFVSQGIPNAEVQRTQKENPSDIVSTVFSLLKSWKQIKGFNANFETLRAAISDDGIQIDLRTYDHIVNGRDQKQKLIYMRI